MKNICLLLFTLLCVRSFAQENKNGDTQKAPAVYVLTIDGKDYELNQGQGLKLNGSFNNPTVSVKPAAHRKFDNGTVSFTYNSSANYQFSDDPAVKTWTFDDGDFMAMFFEMQAKVTIDALIEGVLAKFGKKNCKVSACSKMIGDKMLNGKHLDITLVGEKLTQEYYEVGATSSKTYIMTFQQVKDDKGTIAPEALAAMDQITSSFKFSR